MNHRTRWLAVTVTLATALVVATTSAPAAAEAPTRIDTVYWGIDCILPVAGGGTLYLYGGGSVDTADGGFGAFVEDAEGRMVATSIPGDVPLAYGDHAPPRSSWSATPAARSSTSPPD